MSFDELWVSICPAMASSAALMVSSACSDKSWVSGCGTVAGVISVLAVSSITVASSTLT